MKFMFQHLTTVHVHWAIMELCAKIVCQFFFAYFSQLCSVCVAICEEACYNGGVCVAPNQCNCTLLWSGIVCNLPICNPICRNGGTKYLYNYSF